MTNAQQMSHALGGEWRGQSGIAPCPVCQPERRADQRALSVRQDGSKLLVFCHKGGCDFRDILDAAGLLPGALAFDPDAAREADAKRAAYEADQNTRARKLWALGQPIAGTKGEAHLRSRGITCPLPQSLRWVSDCYHSPSGRWLSAMVADVSTGGVHRTFFDKSGARIGTNAKMMQGPCAGGAVCLAEAEGPLVVCEGIETGLSLASGLLRGPATIWAALSTSGMRGLHLPAMAGRLTIASDGDEPGREAANTLAERSAALGWKVSLLPAPNGRDWNDVLFLKDGKVQNARSK